MSKINKETAKKIVRKPKARTGELFFGKGTTSFKCNGEVAAFEMDYSGTIQGVKKLGEGWTIKFGRNKIIIFSLAKTELQEVLFTYTGKMEITSCKFVTWDGVSREAALKFEGRNTFNSNQGTFGSEARKYEEVAEDIVPAEIRESKI